VSDDESDFGSDVLDEDRVGDDVEAGTVPDALPDSSLLKASSVKILQEDGLAPTIGSMETMRRLIDQY